MIAVPTHRRRVDMVTDARLCQDVAIVDGALTFFSRFRHEIILCSRSSPHRHVSPPRKIAEVKKEEPDEEASTVEGKRAGLQSASALREETHRMRRHEEKEFTQVRICVIPSGLKDRVCLQLDEEATGRHANTVFRDKATGRRRDLTKENEKKEALEAEQRALEEKYQKWNKCAFVSARCCKDLSSFSEV